jgi:hypothetical protein
VNQDERGARTTGAVADPVAVDLDVAKFQR